jgi:hypothetical protein
LAELLAVDVGLRTGLALFRDDGRLVWYRSQHYANRASLKRAIRGLLDGLPCLTEVVLEGGGPLAETWSRAAGRRGVRIHVVSAESWRADLLLYTQCSDRSRAKKAPLNYAHRVIVQLSSSGPTSLRHDAAEAILIGFWAARKAGWIG